MITKTNRVDLRGNVTILGLSGTEAKVFSWYDVRAKIKRCWHGCSGREAPIAMVVDARAVSSAEIWDNAVGRLCLGLKLECVGLEEDSGLAEKVK